MAIGTPTLLASGTSTTNNTTCVTAGSGGAGTAGSLIVVISYARTATQLTATVSDSAGLTWTNRDFATTAQGGCTISYAEDATGVSAGWTATTTWSVAATRKGTTAYVVTGLDATLASVEDTAFRPTGAAGATGNASITAAAASAQNDEIFFNIVRHNAASGSVTGTPNSGWNEIDDFIVGTTTFVQCYAQYRIASTTETPTVGVTFSDTTTNWHSGLVAFKAAAGGSNYTDSGTLTATFVLSGADTADSADSGTLTFTPILSGTDATSSSDAATLPVVFTLSGTDVYTPAGYNDAGTITVTYALSGTDAAGSVDSGILTASFVLSGTGSVGNVDSATLPVTFTLSGSSSVGNVDAATLPVVFTLSGSDTYTSGSAQAPPVTVRTYATSPNGRTKAGSGLSATTASGSSGIVTLTGSSGATDATGTSGKTGAH